MVHLNDDEKSKEINEQIEFGLNSIDPEATIEIKLRDFMFIYKTMEEFNRFFHQRMHYTTIKDIEIFLGDRDAGAYSIIHKLYYDTLHNYMPKEISEKFGKENNPLENPRLPYYYR
ncbi:hypothetical protein [Flagellimonas marinaquae]